jgi:predicted metal-dependent phosphoesterase TrpH
MTDIEDIIDNKQDFADFAGDYLADALYAELCNEYLGRPGTLEERFEACGELYELMFTLTLRMSRLCPVYDDGFVAHIAREAFMRDSGAWEGMTEKELRHTLRERLKRRNRGFAIDCHVHTSDGSACAEHPARLMVEAAVHKGLNGLIITEHSKLTSQNIIDALNAEFSPFRVFSGIEIRIRHDDFLVLGLHDEILNRLDWEYIELYQYVREHNGYIALAHPMRCWMGVDTNVFSFRPDALEIYSVNMDNVVWERRQQALRFANDLGVRILANSDAHATNAFRYCNVLEREPADESELVRMLKAGEYRLGRAY